MVTRVDDGRLWTDVDELFFPSPPLSLRAPLFLIRRKSTRKLPPEGLCVNLAVHVLLYGTRCVRGRRRRVGTTWKRARFERAVSAGHGSTRQTKEGWVGLSFDARHPHVGMPVRMLAVVVGSCAGSCRRQRDRRAPCVLGVRSKFCVLCCICYTRGIYARGLTTSVGQRRCTRPLTKVGRYRSTFTRFFEAAIRVYPYCGFSVNTSPPLRTSDRNSKAYTKPNQTKPHHTTPHHPDRTRTGSKTRPYRPRRPLPRALQPAHRWPQARPRPGHVGCCLLYTSPSPRD